MGVRVVSGVSIVELAQRVVKVYHIMALTLLLFVCINDSNGEVGTFPL